MARINGTLTFVDKNGEDKSIVRVIEDLTEVKFGNHLSNDILIKSEDVEELHCKIFLNEIHRIIIKNYSTSHPILVNNQVVERSKELKSGDVITILGNSMRWETKDDAKRRVSCLSKAERRALKNKFIKTNKRVTIHSVSVQSITKSSPVEASSSSSDEKVTPEPLKSTPEETEEEFKSPVKEQQGIPKDKENEKTPVKVNKLNMSGTLLTSYTPPVGKLTRSVTKIPWNSPLGSLGSPSVKSAAKSILNDSLNVSKFNSPKSAQKLNTSQMHLIDLTTPFVKRTESTPKASTIRKTPRTIGKTPLRNATLLKSAIKNSSIQKSGLHNVSSIATKGKQLFESPAKSNTSIKDESASLIEISMSSVSEVDSSKASINDNSNCEEVQKVEENNGKTNDEVKDLLETIDSVLEEDKESQPVVEPEEIISSSQELEDNFNKIAENEKLSVSSANESLFDKALNSVPIEDINNFDKLVTDEGTSSMDDTEKKGEIVLKLIEKARESLSTPNKTTQVLSARYSNITNDSLTDCVNISQKYDAKTPKISLLETVMADPKSNLSMGPVSRLSLTKDSTEIVENYQLNDNNSESLRSTRKRMRTAMSSIGILNASQSADTTLNESLNVSINDKDQVDFNQSQPEETNILSLDNQPDLNTSNKENEFTGPLNMSMKFIEYSEFDENNQESKTIFELSHDGDDLIESDNESESDEEEESPNEDNDELVEDEIIDENNENVKEVESNNGSTMKCRISQADLESIGEDGISILEQSKDEEQLEELLADAEMQEVQENEKSKEMADNNGIEVIPEPATDKNGVNDFEDIPETQQIELEEELAEEEVPLEKSEYLDDIPETQQMDFGTEEVLETNSTFDGTIERLDSTKEGEEVLETNSTFEGTIERLDSTKEGEEVLETNNTFEGTIERFDSTKEGEPSIELEKSLEDIQQEELPVEKDNDNVENNSVSEANGNEQLGDTIEQLDENVENKLDDTVVSDQLEETVEESFNEHIEIPATQAFEFDEDDSIVVEGIYDTSADVKDEGRIAKFETIGSIVSVNDSSIMSSQEPVNKSDTAESISIQEISDSSVICSQESNIARLGSSLHVEDLISENESNEIVNNSVTEEPCEKQESKETLPSITSNVSATINELIATPTDMLTSIAVSQQYSTSDIGSDHMEIPATQEMIEDEFDSNEIVEEKTVEGDSAIGTTASKIDQSNESEEKRVNDSINEHSAPSRESALFSDTEFSNVEINASAFLKETDADDFPEIKNNQELTDKETNQAQTDVTEEDKSEKHKELIEKELEKVDFEAKIVKNSKSILPSEIESLTGSRKTMIPDQIDDSFAAFIEDKQKELKESDVTESVQDEIKTNKNKDIEITSSVNEEKMNEIEMELARMNAEPITNFEKKRPASMMPQFEDGENSNKVTSRMTILPSEDDRRTSFLESLEEEKAEVLKQKETVEISEEKPIIEDDKEGIINDELSSGIQDEEETDKNPVKEEPCIKKQAYVTTENENQVTAPETPSRRRVARVNYSELATGSPARSKRGRSASTESNGEKDKEPKSAVKRKEKCVKMEPIVEDEVAVQITVTATENSEQVKESNEEVPVPVNEEKPLEVASEVTEKEPESKATEENIEEPVEETVSQPIDEKLDPQEETANSQDNEVIPDSQEKEVIPDSQESEEIPDRQEKEVIPDSQDDEVIPDSQEKEEIPDSQEKEVIPDSQEKEVIPENATDDTVEKSNEDEPSVEHPENLQLMELPKPENLQVMEVPTPDKLQVMEVTKPEHLSVVEVKKPSQEHPKENDVEDISKNVDSPQKENEILEPVDDKLVAETENIEAETSTEEHIDENPESTTETQEKESEPIEELAEKIDDEIIESTEKEDSEPVEKVSDDIVETSEKDSVESVQEEIVQKVEVEPEAETSPEVDEKVQIPAEEVPSESSTQEEEIAPKVEEVVIEPQTPSRKRAKKLNYLELASGSPARTPRRGRAASTEEKQEKTTKPDLPPTIPEELSDKTKEEEVVSSTNDELVTKEVVEEKKEEEKLSEVKKKPGRARKIEQLKPENEDVPTPSKRSRRGVTPVQTPIVEPEKKSRKRQQKIVEPEPELPQEKESEPEVQSDNVITISSSESIQETAKSVAKRGRGKQAKAVEEVPKEDEKAVEEKSNEEPPAAKKGRGRKAKVVELPTVEEKSPEKVVETSPKRGRGRKVVEEHHEEKTEVEKVAETPVAKNSRKRQQDKPAETEKPKDTEDIKTDEIAKSPVESPQPAKQQSRAQKATEEVEEHVEPKKATVAPKRGRKAQVEAVEEVKEPQKEEPAPKRAGRKGKVEDVEEIHEEPAVHEAPKKGRGRKKVEEAPKEPETEPEKVEEPAPKRTGRKGKNEATELPVPETPTEESVPKRAGRKGKLETLAAEDNPVPETPKRGRKAKVDATPVVQETPQQTEEVVPKKGGRKGKTETVTESQEEAVTQEAPKKGRGRKKVEETPKVEEPQSSNVQEEEEEETVVPVKKGRGRQAKKAEETPKVEEPQSSNVQEEEEEETVVPVKKGRGRQAKVVEKVIETKTDEVAEVETEAPKRGRAQKQKAVEPETNDHPVTKKPRGRQAKQEVNTKEPEPSESPKQAKTPVKKKIAAKHVTIVTPSTMQGHHSKETTKSEEPVVAKRATKRQAQPVIEEEPVTAKRSTRVRK
ncbi:fap1 adhesin-like [Chironomus tepperi]|uniref:fap1 adhesin-like n=1 Tax=Chironomus tepperi TaxID=113505 RepID=UPI00391EEE6A